MREFGKIITRKTDLTDAQVQEKYKFPAIIILHDNEDQILKITHYQKNGTKTIYDFSLSASKQFVTDSIATAIAGLQDNRLEFNKFSDFPAIGDETKFYIDLSEDKTYIWDSNSQTYKSQSWGPDSVGSTSQQLSLSSIFRINQDGNANKVDITAGILFSQNLDKTWTVPALVTTLPDNDYRYVYAKASKTTSAASIYLSKNQILFDSDANDYYFLVGILHSVVDGFRVLSITIGTATISGGLVRTGIISSLDGLTSFNLNTGEIKGKITFSSGSSGYENLTDKPDLSSFEQTRDYVNSTLQTDLNDLKNRADGVIESWFYSHTPTLSNLPASNWVTTEERNAHIGDTFTNMQEFVDNATTPDAGKAWRFVKNETTGEFSWSLIANSDSTKALIEAGKAKDTADAKRRVFVSQPYPPYNIGDLWVQGDGGDIMRCKFERLSGSYVATDFEKASKYTDDTAVNNLQIGGRNMLRDSKQPNFNLYDQTIGSIQKLSKAQYPELENDVTYIRVTGGTSDYANLRALFVLGVPKSGELVSVSFKVKNFINPITLFSNAGGRETTINVTNQTTLVKWEGIVGDGSGELQIQIRSLSTDLELYIWDVMYEKGNKATDWTPAPEDVEASILQSKTDSIASAKAYSDAQDALRKTEAAAYADGVVTAAEQRLITDATNKAEAAKTYATAQDALLKTQLESYADGVVDAEEQARINQAQSNLNAAKAYADAQDNLAKIAANAYADGVVSEEEARAIADATAKMEAAKNHAQNLVNNVQIGGRNVVLNSAVEKSGQYNSYQTIYNNNPELVDRAVAVSFDLETDAGNDFQVYSINSTRLQYYTRFTTQTSGKKRYTFIFYLVVDNSNNPHTLRFETYSNNNVPYIISRAKIELGNKATDWTPSPEDVEASILQSKTDSIASAKAYSDAQDALRKTEAAAYADGIVTAAEQRLITDATNKAEAAKTYATAQDALLKSQLEAYADGIVDAEEQARINQAQSNLNAAKAYADAQDNLAKIAANAYADGVVSEEEARAIADATAKMEEAKNHAQGLVNNVQIGGRNLVIDSTNPDRLPLYGVDATITKVIDNNLSKFKTVFSNITRTAGDAVFYIPFGNYPWMFSQSLTSVPTVISFYIRTNSEQVLTGGGLNVSVNSDWKKIEFTHTYGGSGNAHFFLSGADLQWIEIHSYKIEKGNKATDWTPAPEDIQLQIDSEAAKVINLENKTDFLTGTTIEGNAIATGTLLVGNSDGTNAGITGLGSSSDGVYLWGGGTYQQMIQGLAKKEQRRNGIDIWRHPNGQIGFEIGIKDGRLIFNGYHSSGFKLFELDPNRGLVNVSYTQESWTETPFRKLTYSSSTFDESTITNEIKLAIIKKSKMEYYTPPPYSLDSEFGYITTYSLTQNAVGYDYDNGTNPANSAYESLKGMKANYGDRNTNMSNGWYVSSIGEIHMETEWNSYPPPSYTFTVYVYYYQNGKITQTKVVTVTK